MSHMQVLVGEMHKPRKPTGEDQAILDKVKEQYERQSGAKPRKFKAVLVRTQVVTGTNYFFKVDTGRDTYSHVRVFVPQPGLDEEPTLECFQADKTKDDELVYFLADDNRL
ncbi:cystatin-A5-like [Aquarana catesbeiana]|uniref:Leukocyte cysteine proteinase inhibitor 1 n=1 Tax=Aquarana catesbeiana TaxID=8400 RepID=C1C522_AQUCT|nr:Leukocyte cysteine proteinase inhibitor 1 [Aquarana catesbeiana]